MSEYLCKTVRIVSPVTKANPHGYIVINESDLKETHEIYTDAQKADLHAPQQLVTALNDGNDNTPDVNAPNGSDETNDHSSQVSLNDNEDENLNANDGPEAKKPWEIN